MDQITPTDDGRSNRHQPPARRALVAGRPLGLSCPRAIQYWIAIQRATSGRRIAGSAHISPPTIAAIAMLNTDSPPTLARAIGLLVAVWLGVTALTVLWVAALGLDAEEGQALTERLGTEGTLSVIVLVVVVTVVGPVGEEVLFRGYIFRALRNRRGLWPAAITTGVLFAATHLGWVSLALIVPIVVFGIAMCLLYHWTGSLYPCIAVHAFGNAIPLAGALDLTWQAPLLIVGSTLAALTLTRLLARGLGDGQRAAPEG